ncbi:hypothetical protein ACI797_14645 [Geodermatophilus sp. SYSU D00691]
MSRLHDRMSRARATRRMLRDERALRQLIADAPTLESAHEITSLLTRR